MPQTEPHIVTVRGSRTAYWSYGDEQAQPLVLVHGFRGDHHGLELIARELSAHFCVIVPDLPGFGASEPLDEPHTLEAFGRWLITFTEQTVVAPVWSLLGHSFGSLVVSQAIALGLTPATLTLINPISAPALEGPRAMLTQLAVLYYRLGAVLPHRAGAVLLRSPLIVRAMSVTMAKTKDRQLRAWIHDQHDRYFSAFTNRASLLEAFTASVSHTVAEFSQSFTMPTLLIVGERDDITPLAEQLQLAKRVSGSSLRVISGVGHLVHYEAPELAARHTREWISAHTA